MFRTLMAMLFCLPLSACAEEKLPPSKAKTKQHEAVRSWLKENTDSGTWEEVKWWGPIQPFKGRKGVYLRLKFRTGKGSAKSLKDNVFYIVDDEVENHSDNGYKIYHLREFYFEGKKPG